MNKSELNKLFKTYYQELCRFAYYYLQRVDAAEDLVQKIFISLWEKRIELTAVKDIKLYLYKSTKNLALNELKSIQIRREYEEAYITNEECMEENTIDQKQFEKVLLHSISKLPERCRLVYCLKYMEGLSYDEIAVHLDISSKTVDSHIQKALKILKEKLRNYQEEIFAK